jgi:transcriptional regulator with XRE-family HTH domain
MGQLLEKVIRKKGLNITEIAKAIGVQRRTMYNWFLMQELSVETLNRISKVIVYDFGQPELPPIIVAPSIVDIATDLVTQKNEEYWKDKYIDLLERYSEVLNANLSDKAVLV